MANWPGQGPAIQNRSGLMSLLYYLSRKQINILAAFEENGKPMVTVEDRAVRDLQ
jgi:hypothetical protein